MKTDLSIIDERSAKNGRESFQEIKEIRLTPTIASHDLEYKSKNIQKFLESGKKVQIVMKFSHRELHHKDIGLNTINVVIQNLNEFASVEQHPRFNGRHLNCLLSPKE